MLLDRKCALTQKAEDGKKKVGNGKEENTDAVGFFACDWLHRSCAAVATSPSKGYFGRARRIHSNLRFDASASSEKSRARYNPGANLTRICVLADVLDRCSVTQTYVCLCVWVFHARFGEKTWTLLARSLLEHAV
jgi:hypothetical protein